MNNKQKKPKRKAIWTILLVLLVMGVIGSFMPSEEDDKGDSQTVKTENSKKPKKPQSSVNNTNQTRNATSQGPSSPFSLTMLDVGQGLSILICADNHYMLYDGGGRESSSFVVSYLKQNNISTLDYIIASHYDEDHISGLIGVLNTTSVGKALIPNYVASSQTYTSFTTKLETTGTDYQFPAVGETYPLGKAEFQIIGPDSYDHSDDNDCSIAIRIQYGSASCILTGDSTESAESKMISTGLTVDSDLYVVGHHGSASSSSDAFLDAVSPNYAFISVGKDNNYGHPTERVLKSLKNRNIELFRSDVQGSFSAFSDGSEWWFDIAPCDDWSAGDEAKEEASAPPVASDNTTKASEASTYVLNIHTMKFHYPDCSSVSRMKDDNKEIVESSREELINQGYSPCGNCHP